jgi:hypothetical protein
MEFFDFSEDNFAGYYAVISMNHSGQLYCMLIPKPMTLWAYFSMLQLPVSYKNDLSHQHY